MNLSVIIPIYNEIKTLKTIVERVQKTGLVKEIILVDDGSTDGTREVLASYDRMADIQVILHKTNQGKGAAVRSGISAATGDLLLIQDADLEYNPNDYPKLLAPFEDGNAEVVYGSRFLGGPHRVILFWHKVANQLLTLTTNLLFDTILTDMETGYKVFRREVLQGITIRSNRFNFEPEITAKILKRHARIFEVPISFNPRDYSEGKKIKLKDAIEAMWALWKYRIVD
jgi:glycosyltransferase involved in cell wall biosynthesis